ncbi:hypothetical protein [Gaetbulibacter aestuarii]|uniref:Cytochrome c domain-containing protein n=1 Tax=Gaetbulibacter aestuarii TaxID=1502358 RepID=A0ABW7MWE2_9FLAO
MFKKKKLIFVFICLSALSCTSVSTDDLIEDLPQGNTITYVDHVKPIIDNNCISCHGISPTNGASISLVSYTNVKNGVLNNNLISKINGNGPGSLMPYGGQKLPQNLIDIITEWQAMGFIEK